jgi:hypothetical protein
MPTGKYKRKIGLKRRPMSKQTKKKIGNANRGKYTKPKKQIECIICNKSFFDHQSSKRKVCSWICRNELLKTIRKQRPSDVLGKHWKLSDRVIKNRSGVNSCMWKGGITSLYNRIYNSFEYRRWRCDVLKRDWFHCQKCGCKRNLRPHHIKTVKDIIAEYVIKDFGDALICNELWDINNGITFCERCHRIIHKRQKWT